MCFLCLVLLDLTMSLTLANGMWADMLISSLCFDTLYVSAESAFNSVTARTLGWRKWVIWSGSGITWNLESSAAKHNLYLPTPADPFFNEVGINNDTEFRDGSLYSPIVLITYCYKTFINNYCNIIIKSKILRSTDFFF